MAASLSNPFLGAPYASAGSFHAPSLLPSRNIIQLPARRSQLSRLRLTTIGSPIKFYSETSPSLGCTPSRRAYCLSSKQVGGRSVDREAAAKVLGGFVAIDLLKKHAGTDITGSAMNCPNPEYTEKMIAAIDSVRERGDSIGGTVTCIVRNFPRSCGSLASHKIAPALAKGVMSIPGAVGFEIGSGFTGTFMTGSEYIDGIQGGISNPKTIKMRIAFRPMIPISKRKHTVSWRDTHKMGPMARGKIDFCHVHLNVKLVEATVAQLVLCKLIAECEPCLTSPINAVPHEPLESPESVEAQIPLDHFAALCCS